MAKSYYSIDPSDPPSLEEVVRRWVEDSEQATDEQYFHFHLPVDFLLRAREHDRSKFEKRNLDKEQWQKLKHSLQNGWKKEYPVILMVGQDGCVYVGEGNHRLTLADRLEIDMAPVRLIFRQEACRGDRGVQLYDKGQSTNKENDGLREQSDGSPKSKKDALQKIKNGEWNHNPKDFVESLQKTKHPSMLAGYSLSDYQKMKTFKLKGYDMGYALQTLPDQDGREIVSVHNNEKNIGGVGKFLVKSAIKNGGCYLDHFDTPKLSNLYKSMGFKKYSKNEFDRQYLENPKQFQSQYGKADVIYRYHKNCRKPQKAVKESDLVKKGTLQEARDSYKVDSRTHHGLTEAVGDMGLPGSVERKLKEIIPRDEPAARKSRMYLARLFKNHEIEGEIKKAARRELRETLSSLQGSFARTETNGISFADILADIFKNVSLEFPEDVHQIRKVATVLLDKRAETVNAYTSLLKKINEAAEANSLNGIHIDLPVSILLDAFLQTYKELADFLASSPKSNYPKVSDIDDPEKANEVAGEIGYDLEEEKKQVEFEDGYFWYGTIEDPDNIRRIGFEMDNCLKDGPKNYAGQTFVLFSPEQKPKVAAHFKEDDMAGLKWHEIQGRNNDSPNEKYYPYISRLFDAAGDQAEVPQKYSRYQNIQKEARGSFKTDNQMFSSSTEEALEESVEDQGLPDHIEQYIKHEITGEKPIHRKIRMYLGELFKNEMEFPSEAAISAISNASKAFQKRFGSKLSSQATRKILKEAKKQLEEIFSVELEIPDMQKPAPQVLSLMAVKFLNKRLQSYNEYKSVLDKLSGSENEYLKIFRKSLVKAVEESFKGKFLTIISALKVKPQLYEKIKDKDINKAIDIAYESTADLDESKIAIKFEDGYFWYGPAENEEILRMAGSALQNCIRRDPSDYTNTTFILYSDSRSPKVAASFNHKGFGSRWQEIKGKQNTAPQEKYWPYISRLFKETDINVPKNFSQYKSANAKMQEGDLNIGGHRKESPHRPNNLSRRAFRPTDTTIIGGLFESEDEELQSSTHLYNNLSLTFDDIANILDKASEGELKGYERADGYRFFFTVEGNEIKIARTKSEMKRGGYTIDKMRNKTWEGESIMDCCRKGLRELEKNLYDIKTSLKDRIFDDGNIYYRATIVSDDIDGVVDYSEDFINVDKVGCFKTESGNVEGVNTREAKKYSQYLDRLLDNLDGEEHQIQRTAVQNLQALDNTEPLQKAVQSISEQLSRYDLSSDDTVGAYLTARIRHMLHSQYPELNEEELEHLFEIITRKARFSDVEDQFQEEHKSVAKEFSNSPDRRQRTLRLAIWPIQKIIQRFTAKLLKGLESAYVLKDESNERVKERIQDAIDNIQKYGLEGHKKAERELVKQLEAIESIDDLEIPLREFVFSYDNKLLKFSGNYDPARTILTLYSKGMNREDIPSIKQQINEASEQSMRSSQQSHPMTDKKVAVIPGDFKPPHAGHYELAEHMAHLREADGSYVVDECVILVSPRKRVGHSPENRVVVTPEMSRALWELFIGGDDKMKVEISEYKSPLRSAFSFMDEYLDEGDTLWIAQGEKEENSDVLEKLQDYADARQLGIHVEVEETELYHKGVSSTQLRHYLAEKNEEAVTGFMPDHLTLDDRKMCYDMIMEKQPKKTFYENQIPVLNTIDEEEIESSREFQVLKEGGGVSSHWPVFGPMRNEPRKDATPREQTPHQIDKEKGNYDFGNSRMARDSDEESVRQWKEDQDEKAKGKMNRKVSILKSLKEKLQKLQTKAGKMQDKDKIKSINQEIEQTRKKFENAKEELVEYFVKNFSELNIDEISAAGGGAVSGTPNPGASANIQNKEAVKKYQNR